MNKVMVFLDDANSRVTVQVELWNAKAGKNPDVKVPKKHVQSWFFEFSEFLVYLQNDNLSSPSLNIGTGSENEM